MPGDLADLIVWREAAELAQLVIREARHLQGPGAASAADQLVRAGDSIPANIAEAYGRGFGKDGGRFLRIARGSAAELESHLWLAGQVGRLSGHAAEDLLRRTRRVRAMLRGLIHSSAKCAPRG
jgi:four helix bundle protein